MSRCFPIVLQQSSYATVTHKSPSSLNNPPLQNKASSQADAKEAVLRTYKPRTPGLRHLVRPINDHLWKGRPYLPLTYPKKGMAKGGRNASGQITVRHRGGGAKRRVRVVDFARHISGDHLVERIEYDPNRGGHLALITEKLTGMKSYILAADGMRAGDVVQSYRAGLPQDLIDSMGGIIDPAILASKTAHRGNCLPLHMVPTGTKIFNIGLNPRGGGVFCRGAGTFGVIMTKEDTKKLSDEKRVSSKVKLETFKIKNPQNYVNVKLQSGEVRRVHKDCCCTIGICSNIYWNERQLGKAGRSRWLNIRPTVRGVAMNKGENSSFSGSPRLSNFFVTRI